MILRNKVGNRSKFSEEAIKQSETQRGSWRSTIEGVRVERTAEPSKLANFIKTTIQRKSKG